MKQKSHFKWIYLLLIFACLGIIVTAIIKVVTPQEDVVVESDFVNQSLTKQKTNFDNLSLRETNLSNNNPPQKLTVYKIQTNNKSPKQLANEVKQKLISKYKLNQQKDSSLWIGTEYYLSYTAQNLQYSLSKQVTPDLTKTIDQNQAISVCNDFIQEVFPVQAQNFKPIENQVRFYKGKVQYQPATESQANWVKIPYSLSQTSYSLYLKNSAQLPISCLVNNSLQIHKFIFQEVFYQISPVQDLSTISLDQAMSNLNEHNKGAIIEVDQQNQVLMGFELDQIQSGSLKFSNIEYRLDPDKKIAYPFYRFSSTIVNDQNQSFSAQIITPAIRTEKID